MPLHDREDWLLRQGAPAQVEEEVRRLLDHASGIASTFRVVENPPAAAETHTGALLSGRFEIIRLIGVGGMGEVYEAFDRELRQTVALKRIRSELAHRADLLAQFRREVAHARRVVHHNVCRLYDLHRDPVCLSMELLGGETLHAKLSQGPLPLDECRAIAAGLCAGLQAIHQAQIVHRDFKSANIIVVPQPHSRPVITDFGLARDTAHRLGDSSLFSAGTLVGTPSFMAPEVLDGQPAVVASDIYALGVVLFHMVTGRLPFEGRTPMEVALRRSRGQIPSALSLQPQLPLAWDWAIARCLSTDPAHRPPSAAAVWEMMDRRRSWLSHHLLTRRALVSASVASGVVAIASTYLATRPRSFAPEAVLAFQRGEQLAKDRRTEQLKKAIAEFQKAIALEPDYADAHASLAEAYCTVLHFERDEAPKSRALVTRHAEWALRLDSRCATAKAALAYLRSIHMPLDRTAQAAFLEAIETDPSKPGPHLWFATFLGRIGAHDLAIKEAREAGRLAPTILTYSLQVATELYRAGDFAASRLQALTAIESHDTDPGPYLALARACEWLHRLDDAEQALREAERLKSSFGVKAYRATLAVAQGRPSQGQQALDELQALWKKQSFETGVLVNIQAALGKQDAMLASLQEGLARQDASILATWSSPYVRRLGIHEPLVTFYRQLGF